MNTYAQAWKTSHAVLPVIHVESLEQARRNAHVAFDAGADGIFLINHGLSGEQLLGVADKLRGEFDKRWIGINCLDFPNERTIERATLLGLDGVWADNGHIDEDKPMREQERADVIRKILTDRVMYFGGVAFKTQRPSKNPWLAAKLATPYMDVVTTSGPGTAKAADLDKIRQMRGGAGDALLGIASGITPENVKSYMPYANCFLVASGIGSSWSELDPTRVRMLVQAVKS